MFKYKKGRGIIAQTIFVLSISAVAVSSAFGIMFLANNVLNTEVETVADIQGNFGSTYGFNQVEQKRETSETGMLSTTISLNIDTDKVAGLGSALSYLAQTIDKVNSNEIINLDLTVTGEQEIHIKYYAENASDYKDGDFNKILKLAESIGNSKTITHYNLEYRHTNSGRFITVNGGTTGLETETDANLVSLQAVQQHLLNLTKTDLGLKYGDVYDVTFENLKPNSEDTSFIPFSFRTVFDTEFAFNEAVNFNHSEFVNIANFAAHKPFYSAMNIQAVSYTQTPAFHSGQLVVVLVDSGPEKLEEAKGILTSLNWTPGKIMVPMEYDVVLRYTLDGVNQATFHSYYAG